MRKAVISLFALSLLAFFALTGCSNPISPASSQTEAATGNDEWLYEPFTVVVQLGGGADRSIAGPDAARITGSHIRNYLQAVVVNQAGEIAGFAETRRTGAEEINAVVKVDGLPLNETYQVMLLMGHWERDYDKETGGAYVYTEGPPTLLAAGLKEVKYTEDGQSVYVQLWPLYVDTVFTSSEATPASTEPVVSQGKPGAVSLLPVNWDVKWTVKEGKDSKGNGSGNGFDRLIQAQKAADSGAGDILLVKSTAALLRSGGGETALSPAISGNTVSASLGAATAGFAKIAAAGSVNFALEYVPFNLSAWTHPVWIIRNGLNGAAQDGGTDFTNFGLNTTANANGAVRYTVATQTAGDLKITAGKFEGPGSSYKPEISFTTAGYSGDAEAYYALVPKGSGAPAYSAYKSLGNAAAGDHR
ncbi:MAG: hypothetical protein LBT95_02525, partial [Treponema sp.]|nr:hypothetical protein [Treponema sp.]